MEKLIQQRLPLFPSVTRQVVGARSLGGQDRGQDAAGEHRENQEAIGGVVVPRSLPPVSADDSTRHLSSRLRRHGRSFQRNADAQDYSGSATQYRHPRGQWRRPAVLRPGRVLKWLASRRISGPNLAGCALRSDRPVCAVDERESDSRLSTIFIVAPSNRSQGRFGGRASVITTDAGRQAAVRCTGRPHR